MKKIQKLLAIVLCLITMLTVSVSAADGGGMDNVPYDTYTYWNGYNTRKLVSARPMFEVSDVLSATEFGVDEFSEIKDLFCDDEGNIYILDTTKLVIVDSSNNINTVYNFLVDENGRNFDFTNSRGVFVDKEKIYIADGTNEQILISDKNGVVKEIISNPVSSMIPDDFVFCPSKVTTGVNGDIYVLSEGCFYGALLFDSEGVFKGFFGANTVVGSIGDFFSNLWDNFFTTDEQKALSSQKVPYQFTDICADSEGFIWTCTGIISKWKAQSGQIRCISPSGKNILRVNAVEKNMSSESFDFSDEGLASDGALFRVQDFVGIAVDESGFIYGLDRTYGKIFVYDSDCNALNIFGGGVGEGTQEGTFENANAIAVGNDRIYVCDSAKNTVTIYEKTEYGKLVTKADSFTLSGKHSEAMPLWQEVLSKDRNSQVAYRGIAKALIIQENYSEALYYAKNGLDKESYSTAFYYVRNEWIKTNFVYIVLFAVFVLALVVSLLIVSRRKQFLLLKNARIKNMLNCIIHPFAAFNRIKYNREYSVTFGVIIIVLYYAAYVSSKIFGGFLHSTFDSDNFNSILLLLGSVGVVLLWVVCNWAMTVAVSGKSNIRETFVVASCAVIPQFVYNVLFLILSNVFSIEESGALTLIFIICAILSFVILCIGTMVINEFDFFKFLATGIATLIAMAVVIFFCFMLFILFQQLFGFIATIFNEVWYR